jgi:GAF domain-containing protein
MPGVTGASGYFLPAAGVVIDRRREAGMSLVELSDTGSGADDQASAMAYLATLQELTGLLVEEAPFEVLLEQLLELTSRAITSSAAVSVTVVGDLGGYVTAASTCPAAERIDALQYELQEGPCVDALETGRRHHLRDLAEPERWPAFRARARAHGFGTVLSVPLVAGGTAVGALNVFAEGPDGLEEPDVFLAERIAAPAAATLANARAYRRALRLGEQLQEALESRAVIEQAKGLLMGIERIDADEAFERLRQISQRTNVKVRDVAVRLLAQASSG